MCPTGRSFLQPRLILPRCLIRDHPRALSDRWTYHVTCDAVDEQGHRLALYSGPTQCTISDEYKEEEQFYRSGGSTYNASDFAPMGCEFLESLLSQSAVAEAEAEAAAAVDGIRLEAFDFEEVHAGDAYFADVHGFDTQSVVLAHVKHCSDANNNDVPGDHVDKLTSELLAQLPDDVVYRALEPPAPCSGDALVEILASEPPPCARSAVLYFEENPDYGHNLEYVDPTMCRTMNDEVDKYMDESLDHISIPDCPPTKSKGKHSCPSCSETFSSMMKLRSHQRTKHNDKSNRNAASGDTENFYCDKCSRKFSCRERWQTHRQAHSDPDLECARCSKVLGSKASLKAHQRIHNRKFSCEYCAKTYETEAQFKAHASKKHSIFACEQCEFTSRDEGECSSHRITHFSLHDFRLDDECILEENFLTNGIAEFEQTNDDAGNEAVEEENIDLLVVSKMPPEELEDDIINLQQDDDFLPQFYTEEDDFEVDDFEDDNFDIEEVPASTSRELDSAYRVVSDIMQTETRNKHAKVKKKLVRDCVRCEKHFDRGSDFKRHAIEHVVQETYRANHGTSGTPVFRCRLCEDGRFARVDRLKAHLRQHLKLRLYQCNHCSKTFSDSSNYSKHKKVHGAQVFQCDTCKRKFNTKKMIAQHMDYHKKTQPLHCEFCGKEYYFESNLKKHVNVHHRSKGKGSFSCQSCRMKFPSMRLKWDHQWSEHGVRKKVNDCTECRAKFRKYSELKRHLRERH